MNEKTPLELTFAVMTLVDYALSFAAASTSPLVCAIGLILTTINMAIFK